MGALPDHATYAATPRGTGRTATPKNGTPPHGSSATAAFGRHKGETATRYDPEHSLPHYKAAHRVADGTSELVDLG